MEGVVLKGMRSPFLGDENVLKWTLVIIQPCDYTKNPLTFIYLFIFSNFILFLNFT